MAHIKWTAFTGTSPVNFRLFRLVPRTSLKYTEYATQLGSYKLLTFHGSFSIQTAEPQTYYVEAISNTICAQRTPASVMTCTHTRDSLLRARIAQTKLTHLHCKSRIKQSPPCCLLRYTIVILSRSYCRFQARSLFLRLILNRKYDNNLDTKYSLFAYSRLLRS
jgi:hypothetical protein